MPQIGEGRLRFGRSYIWLNPDDDLGPATWRLTGKEVDNSDDPTPSDFFSQAVVRSDTSNIIENQLIYIDDNGQAGLADASSILTARVAGVAVGSAVAGSFVTYTRNQPKDILNVSTVVDGAPVALEQGRYYWLSSTNPGNYTRTPDTTTSGAVLMQVGLALGANEFTIEIQNPVVI